MPKDKVVRSRISNFLNDRLESYIANEIRRGRSVDKSTVLVDALVEYLDKNEPRPELWTQRLNEPSSADPPGTLSEEAKRILRKNLAEKPPPPKSGK